MRKNHRGQIGLVVILLALLIVGFLVVKLNLISFESPSVGEEKTAPKQVIEKFQNDAHEIEKKMQDRENLDPNSITGEPKK